MRMQPTRRLLWLATAGLLVSLAGMAWPTLAVLATLAALGLVGLEVMELDTRPPLVALHVPARVSVGQTFEAMVGAMPRARAWFSMRVRLETDEGLDAGSEVRVARVGVRHSHRASIALTARRRGPATVRAMWVRVTGPLGLLESIHRVEMNETIRVSPNLAAVRQLSMAAQAQGAQGGVMPVVTTGAGTEFDELRPYTTGMDSRSIDWKSSARHRELRVRRYREEQNQQLVLMVDNHAFEGVDHAVHAGLALARTALAQGDRVALQLFGAEPRAWVPLGHGARHLHRLVSALSDWAPETPASNPVHAAHALAVRLRRRSIVVMFTDAGDPVRASLVAEAARVLETRHRVVVVALRDPQEDALPRPERLEDVAQTLLRRNLGAERERATHRLRTAGVSVVSVGPRGIAGALLQQYRSTKRRAG